MKPILKILQEHFSASIHAAHIIKPDNFWQKQRTSLGSQKYKFEVRLHKCFVFYISSCKAYRWDFDPLELIDFFCNVFLIQANDTFLVLFTLVRFDLGLVRFGLVWFGLVWFGLVWLGLVRLGF